MAKSKKLTKNEIIGVFSGIMISVGGWFIATPMKEWILNTFRYGWILPLVGVAIILVVLYFIRNGGR